MSYRSKDQSSKNPKPKKGWSLWSNFPRQPIQERILDGIPGFIAWFALLYSVASAVAFPKTLLAFSAAIGLYSSIRFTIAAYANQRGIRQIQEWKERDWHQHYLTEKDSSSMIWEDVQHIVIIPNYKEPQEILIRTLDNLKAQYEAKKRITIVLAMEENEENCEKKANFLVAKYQNAFKNVFYTIHPANLPGEIQCKSANEAWAGKWIKQFLIDQQSQNIHHYCLTTQDADTRWDKNYFYCLTALFALNPNRYEYFWQAPIRYHGNIWDINPLMRIVNAFATAMEAAYLANPLWLALPMSSYSLSLKLLDESAYWDGDVIADEWHMFIKAFFFKKSKVKLEAIMLPFLADATVGDNIWQAIKERYKQTLRHAWGSKEVGYTVAKIIDNPDIPIKPSIRLLLRIAHDILLAGAGWVILTVGSQLPVLLHPEIAPFTLEALFQAPNPIMFALEKTLINPSWFILSLASLLVILMGMVFWYQDVLVRPPRTKKRTIKETALTLISFPLLPVLSLLVLALPTIQAQTKLLLGIPLQFKVTRKS
ncbi:hypothetical protein MASR2M15_20310 [Anaerolineales bacterium]